MPAPKQPLPTPTDQAWPGDTNPEWDLVDEASWESFPASDPPSYSTGRAVAEPCDPANDAQILPQRHPSWRARVVVAGMTFLVLGGFWMLRALRRRAR